MPKQKQPSREARKSEQREESAAPASPSSNESSQSMRKVSFAEAQEMLRSGRKLKVGAIRYKGRVIVPADDASASPSSKEGEPKK